MTLPTFDSELLNRKRHIHGSTDDDVFGQAVYRRFNSSNARTFSSPDSPKRQRFSEDADVMTSGLSDDFISAFSFDFLWHIGELKDADKRETSTSVSLSSADSDIVVQSTDSSSEYSCTSFHEDLLGGTESSTIESNCSPVASVKSGTKSVCTATGKSLYTAELEVLCRICGDRASGFHYGVHSCEGCKGFFRRTLKKGLVYKPCRENTRCRIDAGSRNKCQYCRYQKCLMAGMSHNAVRFGRMPKVEREKLVADKEELSASCQSRFMDLRSLADTIKGAFVDCFKNCGPMSSFLNCKETLKIETDQRFVAGDLSSAEFNSNHIYESYQRTVVQLLQSVVRFTKRLPNFSDLDINDRIFLLKQNGFGVTVILMYILCEELTLYLDSGKGHVAIQSLGRRYICWEAQILFDGVFQIAKRLQKMKLKIGEIALFASIVSLLECPGLKSASTVEKQQGELLDSLRLELKHNHPKEPLLLPRLLLLIPQIVQISEEFRVQLKGHLYDETEKFSETHELLVEVFDLC